jgi:hypothetical protein
LNAVLKMPVSVLNWNRTRSAVRRFAWIRTGGCKHCIIYETFEKKEKRHGAHFFSLLWSRFHASRYPALPKDTAHKFDPATHNHVVFIRNNRFFEVQLAYPDGTELSAADLEAYESTLTNFFLDKG